MPADLNDYFNKKRGSGGGDDNNALAQARARDEEIARASVGATYAGDADPYRHDDEAPGQTDAAEAPGRAPASGAASPQDREQ